MTTIQAADTGRIPLRALDSATNLLASMITTFLAITAVASVAAAGDIEEPPPGVQMLLRRGGIPAVFEPRFVSAAKAGLPDSAWVLGVAMGGEARAYSLNLLNGHEIVNDALGGKPIAAVW
jgi:hypothetical protein